MSPSSSQKPRKTTKTQQPYIRHLATVLRHQAIQNKNPKPEFDHMRCLAALNAHQVVSGNFPKNQKFEMRTEMNNA